MKGIFKKGLVIASLLAFTLSTVNCEKKKDDDTGLLLAALFFLSQNEWSVTMDITVKQAGGTVMTTATHNRAIEFTQGVNASVQGSVSKDLVLTTNERIRALATSGAQAGAGKITLSFKQNSQSQRLNITSKSLKSGGNADLIDDYTTDVGTGSFTLVANDADPTNLNQVVGLTITNQVLEVTAIRVVRRGSYNLASPTAGENVCDGIRLTGSPTTKTGTISASESWSNGILLSGTVNVESGATITIQPGTVIFGQRGSSIFFKSGTTLVSKGTAELPICWTSSSSPGSRSPGDWGGIVMIGNSGASRASNTEGTTPVGYGGAATGSSNNLQMEYTIIEFAGNEVAPGDELNNLSIYASNSTLSNVQVHRGLDDGFEAWGGSGTWTNLIATGGLDDDYDLDEGFQGTLSNLIAHKYPTNCGGTSSTDPHGFEMDGTHSPTSACGDNNLARCTTPTVSGFTLIGQNISGSQGMRLREGLAGTFSNGLIYNFNTTYLSGSDGTGTYPAKSYTVNNTVLAQSTASAASTTGATNNASASLTALPITSEGNVTDGSCGFTATKPNYTSTASNAGGGAGNWPSGWAAFRAR